MLSPPRSVRENQDETATRNMQHLTSSPQPDRLSDGERRLITALDDMSLLHCLRSDALRTLVKLQEEVSVSCGTAVKDHIRRHPQGQDMSRLLHQASQGLAEEWISEARHLCQILSNPHINNLICICDAVTQKVRPNYVGPRHEYYNVQPSSHSSRTKSRSSFDREPNPIYQSIGSHLTTYHNHEYDVLDYGYDADRSTVKTCDSKFSVKLVQIIKGSEPLGMTVQLVEDTGAAVVSRVLCGSSVHRSGLVAAGDFIYEVNGISLKGRTHKEIIRLLEKESHQESISFKLVVPDAPLRHGAHRHSNNNNDICKAELQRTGIFLKCHFDYNPCLDNQHPCPDAGLLFKRGEVLSIVSQEDDSWWQALHEEDMEYMSRAGIIPSPILQEKRLAALRDLKRQQYLNQKVEIIPGIKSPIRKGTWSRKVRKVMYSVSENEHFEENDLPTYEEVIHLYPSVGFCRPIVLFGSNLVGQKKIVRRLKNIDPETYRTPIAHTTRSARDWELDGAEYFFVSKDWFVNEAKTGNLIEYEEYRGNLYGIHRETVRAIIASGSVCILSLQSQGLKAVRNPLFKPFVVFLKPDPQTLAQSVERLMNEYECDDHNARNDMIAESSKKVRLKRNHFKSLSDDQKHSLLVESSKLEYLYGHYFDVIIVVSDDLEDVLSQVIQVIRSVQLVPQWAPASWL